MWYPYKRHLSSLTLHMAGCEDNDFDPFDAFERFEIDENAINTRMKIHEDAERQARHEESVRQIAREEERAERQRAAEKRAMAQVIWEEEYPRLLPGRLARIEEDELCLNRAPPSNWPPAPGFGDLCMTESEFEQLLHLPCQKGRLQDPCPDRDEHGEPMSRMWQMELYSKNLEVIPSVFQMSSKDHLVEDFHYGCLYKKMCEKLTSAVRYGPYLVDYRRLGCNMGNPHVKRLRTYYQRASWGFYEQIDLPDGWAKLFQLLLVVRPSHDSAERSGLYDYLSAVRRVLEIYSEAVAEARTFAGDGFRTREPEECAIKRAILSTQSEMDREKGHLKKLHKLLRMEEETIRRYIDSSQESQFMTDVRRISRECVERRADIFVERPNDSAVVLLRRIVFGRNPVKFGQICNEWVHAVSQLSDYHDLVTEAFSVRDRAACPR